MNEDRTWLSDAEVQYKMEDMQAEIDRLRAERDGLHIENDKLQNVFLDLNVEIDRLRAENADLAGMLKLYFHAHETGNSLPPYIVTQARAILAKAAKEEK